MVNFTDPKFWTDGANVVISAPQIVFPLLAITAIAAWWFKGSTAKGAIAGLREQVGSLKAQIAVVEERLHLAQDSERLIARDSEQLTAEITALRSQVVAKASKEELDRATATISSTAAKIVAANTELGRLLDPDVFYSATFKSEPPPGR
jgi:hypothetical protein